MCLSDFVWVPLTPHFDFNLHKLVLKSIKSYFGTLLCKRFASTTVSVDVQCLFFWDSISATVLNNSRLRSVTLNTGSSGGQWVRVVMWWVSLCPPPVADISLLWTVTCILELSLTSLFLSPWNQWPWQYLDILSYRFFSFDPNINFRLDLTSNWSTTISADELFLY